MGLITGVDQFTNDQSRKTDLERDGENGSPPCATIHVDFRSLPPSTLRSFAHITNSVCVNATIFLDNCFCREGLLLKGDTALNTTYRHIKRSISILIQAIKKHIPAIGSLLIVVKGRFPDAIPMPERPIIRLEQLDWLAPLSGILRGMICIRPPQATRSRDGVKVRAARFRSNLSPQTARWRFLSL